jgi:hypothetical protein
VNTRRFLGIVFLFFVGLLVAVWVLSERARPVLLDEHGRPVSSARPHGS